MLWPSCGTQNKAGMKLCKKCGCILQEDNYDVVTKDIQQSKEKSPKVLIIAIIAVVLAIIGVVAFLLISNLASSNEKEPKVFIN